MLHGSRVMRGAAGAQAGGSVVQTIESARRRPAGGRIPPHNIEAEESLLGAMLLSRDAIVAAVEARVEANDFYKPAHGHVFDAVMGLYGQGEPADPVTVAEELRRADLLDFVGGRATLLSIQAGTPASANASHYARIVNELALLRRLIAVAGDITEMGYDVPDDVTETLDRAESLVFEVAERRVSDTMVGIHDALQDTLDNLESRYGDDSDLVGRAHRLPRGRPHPLRAPAVEPRDPRGAARHGQDQPCARDGAQRGHPDRPTGHLLLDGDGHARAHQAPPRDGRQRRGQPPLDRQAARGRLDARRARGRSARRGEVVHRRQPALHDHGDARQVPAHARPSRRSRARARRLHPAHDARAPRAAWRTARSRCRRSRAG